uniref:Uncharacterized protein n=1 Tax=Strongyloides venezuelensis TaxID=75913 RepID=A0A0K0EZS2_STRVS
MRDNVLGTETSLSGREEELDELFCDLILSYQIGDTTNYNHKETIGREGYVDDCLSFDPVSFTIPLKYNYF